MIRVRAGISYALAEAMDEGHCGLPVDELAELTTKLIEVPAELIETALALELEAGEVVADTVEGRRCVFLAGAVSGRAGDRRAAASAGRRPAALAGDRRQQGDALGGAADRPDPGGEPEAGACVWLSPARCW